MSSPSGDGGAVVCPSCGGTGEDGAFHPCLQCHGDGWIGDTSTGEQSVRDELARALEWARVALASSDDAELVQALGRIQELDRLLKLTQED